MSAAAPVRRSRRLSAFALGFFGYGVVAAIVSILARWPAQFGGPGDPGDVGSEFLARGTAIAPPLIPLLLLGAGALLVRKPGRLGAVAAIGLLVLGVLFMIGGLGEALAPSPATAPRTVLVVGGLLAAGGGASLATMCAAAILQRLKLARGSG